MRYFLDLFTPETWAAFRANDAKISGFRERQRSAAEKIEIGDRFLCYVVRLSRWAGVLEVESPIFTDTKPIFGDPDPFIVRFNVDPKVTLDLEYAVPILDTSVWSRLTFTKDIERGAVGWAQHASLRSSLKNINEGDGRFIEELLLEQQKRPRLYQFSAQDKQRLSQKVSIRAENRAVYVEVPTESDETVGGDSVPGDEIRESHKVQATLARIGAKMGFRIWVPRSDRQKILSQITGPLHASFLEVLPLNYDETTLRTIEQIDVIWLKGRSMARAFEVEHTTAIYSGLLRMADLLALQPNMDIRLHIVAPDDKREKVLKEIKRPVFSLLDRGPLYESCSYLSYEGLNEISIIQHLSHMSDSIIHEFEEFADE